MNTEIEFRAWDKKNKIMTYSPINCINFNGQLLLNDGEYYDIEKTDYVLMQWTGLLDKNGKKIFKSDILKYDSDTFENIDKEKKYWVLYEPDIARYTAPCVSDQYNFLGVNAWHESIIIGNIFENPELLTQK